MTTTLRTDGAGRAALRVVPPRRHRGRDRDRERGAATGLTVGILAAACAAGAAVMIWSTVAAEATAVHSAADLAALAASDTARGIGNASAPCAAAAEVASANDAVVVACAVDPAGAVTGERAAAHVVVQATRRHRGAWLPLPRSRAEAWAGAPS